MKNPNQEKLWPEDLQIHYMREGYKGKREEHRVITKA